MNQTAYDTLERRNVMNLKELIAICDTMDNNDKRALWLRGCGVNEYVIFAILNCYHE